MKKEIVEFRRYPKHPMGYGLVTPPSEMEALDFIVEWSKLNPDKKIYRHFVTQREDHDSNVYHDVYVPFEGKSDMKIPYCDLVYDIHIFYQ
jgi:hypothetical protein